MKKIFILSETFDPHADRVINMLGERGCYVLRANRDRYGIEWTVEIRDHEVWFINQADGEAINSFTSAWLRRKIARPLFNAVTGFDTLTNDFLTNQNYLLALCSLQAIPTNRIMNHVASNEFANSKANHLKIFKSVGISIPKSLITSSNESLQNFLKKNNGPLALKQVHTDVLISEDEKNMKVQMTKKILPSDFYKLFPIGPSPMYFQEYIEKKYEYRVTTVGNNIFACRIDSQKSNGETKIDWRNYDLENTPHHLVDLPNELQKKILHIHEKYNLAYTAIDLIESTNGEFYGVDINPLGQYLWIEDLVDAPISKCITNWLINEVT